MKWITLVTRPRNRTALTILGLTPEIRCDFVGMVPHLALFNLAKKHVLDKLNKNQLEEKLDNKHVSRYPPQISKWSFQSWSNAFQTFQFYHMVVKNRNRKGKKSTCKEKAIDGFIFLLFSPSFCPFKPEYPANVTKEFLSFCLDRPNE